MMNRDRENGNRLVLCLCMVIILSISFCFLSAHAATVKKCPEATLYQSPNNPKYQSSNQYIVDRFSYGTKAAGTLSISGPIEDVPRERDGYVAYSATGELTIGYKYSKSLQGKPKEAWNLKTDSGKEISNKKLSKKIQKGVVIIQKSSDRLNWYDVTEPYYNFFGNDKIDRDQLYTITVDELKTGMFYRVIVAYQIEKKTGTKSGFLGSPIGAKDIMIAEYCKEVYSFFAYYGSNPTICRDLVSGNNLPDKSKVVSAFIIDRNGSTAPVTFQKDGAEPVSVHSLKPIYEPGEYVITTVDPLGKAYIKTVTITEGLHTVELTPTVYENKKNYDEKNSVNGAKFGMSSHTILTIAHNADTDIAKKETRYGVKGDSICFLLRFRDLESFHKKGWEIVSDGYGKKNKEKIAGAETGEVAHGAILIQKSDDNKNWTDIDRRKDSNGNYKYSSGLYTTDFEYHYGDRGEVLIYTPAGEDIVNGKYYQVYYAYEVRKTGTKETYRYLERYRFYLCSDNLDAVTFHNLTIKERIEEECKKYDEFTSDVYRTAETMLDGAYTTSGFKVDTSKNTTVKYTVSKNGKQIPIPSNKEFIETGKYEIRLESRVGSEKTVTLYVDRMDADEALDYYFGESFIKDKRIYDTGVRPVFESGKTKFHIKAVDDEHLPLSGSIKNTLTGESIDVVATREEKTGTITMNDGIRTTYIAVLSTCGDVVESGDNRVFTFAFDIIPEGMAPGPRVNQESLKDYARKTVSDCNPVYYGFTSDSAGSGRITLAFSDKEKAKEYAVKYNNGIVESEDDGSFRYSDSQIVEQKRSYDSRWDLADDINENSEKAAKRLYFDLSDESTVRSLKNDTIQEGVNLRTYELGKGVILFAPGEKDALTDIKCLPIINSKPYRYLIPDGGRTVEEGFEHFKFSKDPYQCDSASVIIRDKDNKEYSINYDESVGDQLKQQNCPTGIVTIIESTIYGDTATYEAVYFAEGTNTAKLTLSCFDNGQEKIIELDQSTDGTNITANAFSISEAKDPLDPYCLVIVFHGTDKDFFTIHELEKKSWFEPGTYHIKVVNRLGYYYTADITIPESDYITIQFSGEGAEDLRDIMTIRGEQNISLPSPSRIGYDFRGYEDANGRLYYDEISSDEISESITLTPIWRAKKYSITLQNPLDNTFEVLSVDFGATYILPEPDAPEGLRFVGWKQGVNILGSNIIALQEEGNVTLEAVFEWDSNSKQEAALDEAKSIWLSEKNAMIRLLTQILAGMLLLDLLVIFIMKCVNHSKTKSLMKAITESTLPTESKEEVEDEK